MRADSTAPSRPNSNHGARCNTRRVTGSSLAVRACRVPSRKPPRRARSISCSRTRRGIRLTAGTRPMKPPSSSSTAMTSAPECAASQAARSARSVACTSVRGGLASEPAVASGVARSRSAVATMPCRLRSLHTDSQSGSGAGPPRTRSIKDAAVSADAAVCTSVTYAPISDSSGLSSAAICFMRLTSGARTRGYRCQSASNRPVADSPASVPKAPRSQEAL